MATELDRLEGVDDRVQLALVERASGRPAVAEDARRPADQRVEIGVEGVAHALLDAVDGRPWGDLQRDDHGHAAKAHRLQA